jgi:hypothetical protein
MIGLQVLRHLSGMRIYKTVGSYEKVNQTPTVLHMITNAFFVRRVVASHGWWRWLVLSKSGCMEYDPGYEFQDQQHRSTT